ncbi:predicted membrane protein [Candidatus Moduliflexus flocculans]|uniref:Predicted membrane protein n=1 Tax=Candidatus Moduliflexus flocculans TaxID=1499966 RepID=A0A0S6VTC5_9BACT|nr:predicted membrane protein [Candidatus Moduliflexus flocculans]
MKREVFAMFGGLILSVCLACASVASAQSDGNLTSVNGDVGALPAGATYEGGVVSHPITSDQENLHLLAGYYYNNPREWKRIYNDNRSIIRNPNRLPVGQTLKIQVGEGWKPHFTYAEWLQMANRNGQWHSGQTWRRARSGGVPVTAPRERAAKSTPAPQVTEPPAQETPSAEVTPAPEQPAAETPPAAEATPAETPAPEQPKSETPPAAQPENKEVAPILE